METAATLFILFVLVVAFASTFRRQPQTKVYDASGKEIDSYRSGNIRNDQEQ